jgi:hypothetical protein
MDVSVTMMMKNAVKCDNNCDMQPLVNHHIFESQLAIYSRLGYLRFIYNGVRCLIQCVSPLGATASKVWHSNRFEVCCSLVFDAFAAS